MDGAGDSAKLASLSAVVERQSRQLDYLLHLLQQLGLAQKGWESMEIWERYGR